METDEEVEEIVEKEVVKDVVQEIKVPQVKALHPFSGQGLKMAKGEVGRVIRLNSKGWVVYCCRFEFCQEPTLTGNSSVFRNCKRNLTGFNLFFT